MKTYALTWIALATCRPLYHGDEADLWPCGLVEAIYLQEGVVRLYARMCFYTRLNGLRFSVVHVELCGRR
jgi:hypothetical protein